MSTNTVLALSRQIAQCDRVIRENPGTGAALAASMAKRRSLTTIRMLSSRAKKLTPNGTLVRV